MPLGSIWRLLFGGLFFWVIISSIELKNETTLKGNYQKYIVFSIIPLIILFLSLETAQRIRISLKQNSFEPLYYGFYNKKKNEENNETKYILIEKENYKVQIDAAYKQISKQHYIIACIGGSSTVGPWNDPEHRYPFLLQRLINEKIGDDRVRVLNLGKGGRTSDVYGSVIENLNAKLTPNLIIFYTGYNDIFIRDINLVYQSWVGTFNKFYSWCARYSFLLLSMRDKYLIWRHTQRDQDEGLEKFKLHALKFKEQMDKYLYDLDKNGIDMILIPEVVAAKKFNLLSDYRSYKNQYKEIPIIMNKLSKKHHAEYLNLQDYFEINDYKLYFKDPVHLTNSGNNRLSRLIVNESEVIMSIIKEYKSK